MQSNAASLQQQNPISAFLNRLLLPQNRYLQRVVPFLLGLAFLFAFQPYNWAWLFFPLFIMVCHLSGTLNPPQKCVVFWTGWLFGLGYFVGGLHWIAFALHVDIGKFWWLIPFAVLGLPAFLALFFGLIFVITSHLKRFPTIVQLGGFALAWSGMEWIRGHLFGGLPWLNIGELEFPPTINGYNVPLQALKIYGIYGVGLLWLILGAALYGLVIYKKRVLSIILSLSALAALYGPYSYEKLTHPHAFNTQFHEDFVVTMVQPDIPQVQKWDADLYRRNLEHFMDLSRDSIPLEPRVLIWPEAAIPYSLESGSPLAAYLATLLRPQDLLILGAPHVLRSEHGAIAYNSAHLLDHSRTVVARYNKSHLVPFGEYMPLRAYLPAMLDKIAPGVLDFTPGDGLKTIAVNPFPALNILICYEVIFPGAVQERTTHQAHPQWFLNLTNDGWYLNSAGPYQHLQIARLRAIEEGIPLVRSVYRGISAVFDAYGKEIARIPYGKAQALTVKLPKALEYATPYAQYGDWIYFLMILSFLLVIVGVIIKATVRATVIYNYTIDRH
jgi:apolipoprotein N-acyltransferase